MAVKGIRFSEIKAKALANPKSKRLTRKKHRKKSFEQSWSK